MNAPLLRFALIAFSLILPATVWGQTPQTATVQGHVFDDKGNSLPLANVQILETTEGTASNYEGWFSFTTTLMGERQLQASMLGFEPARIAIHLTPGDTITVKLVLKETLITLEGAFVSASSYTTGDVEGVPLNTLDVLLTPGAAADIFHAIKTFPGVAMVNEGAGLFVRGGDVSETITLIDQATVIHPYKFESPTTSVFGTIPPFLVSGTAFSSGGFSARYGNALSGVLDMKSMDMPHQSRYYLNASLAAASLGIDMPILSDKLGIRFSGNRSFTDLLFRVNNQSNEFSVTPRSLDINLSLIYRYSTTGQIKFFNYGTGDRLGVKVDEPSFTGFYRGKTTNQLHNLQWSEVFGNWFLRTSVSLSQFVAHQEFGSLDLRPTNRDYKVRTDIEHPLRDEAQLNFGLEILRNDDLTKGTVPADENNGGPDGEKITLDERFTAMQAGGYVELDLSPSRRIATRIGVRTDYHGLARQMVIDPRISLRYVINKKTDLRFAWGIYHQFPTPIGFNTETGNPDLKAQWAQHFIGGLNHEEDLLLLRIEGYYKPYYSLVIQHPELHLANVGDGMARGVDVFLKYGEFLRTVVHGQVAYSFLQTKRKQQRSLGHELAYERAPSPFDITHNLSIVGQTRLFNFLSAGLTFRYATGRPVTPIERAIAAPDSTYFIPIEGPVGSERLPDFTRLDGQLSYYLPFGKTHNAVFYVSIGNLLSRSNILGYEYSEDYSERNPKKTDYRRFLYFGVTINLIR